MLTGGPPYRTEATQKQLEDASALSERLQRYRRLIDQAGPPIGHRLVRGVDKRLAEIIESCLDADPLKRLPTLRQSVTRWTPAIDSELGGRCSFWSGRTNPAAGSNSPNLRQRAARKSDDYRTSVSKHRALESDALSARLQAASLKDELLDRLGELEAIIGERLSLMNCRRC